MTFKSKLMLATSLTGLMAATGAMADPVWDRIERSGAIPNDKIGSWIDSATGQWEGYEIDLCRAIAADLELEVKFQETSWKTVVLDLQAQKIDIWPGMSATEQRKQALSMVGPMYDLAFCAMDGKQSQVGQTWEELNSPDVRIATVTGTSVEAAFKQFAPNAQHITLSEYSEITLAIQYGRANIMGADVLRCLSVMNAAPNVFNSVFFPSPVQAMGSSAGMVKATDKLTPWLTDWATTHKADGTIRDIFLNVMEKAGYDIEMVPPEVQF